MFILYSELFSDDEISDSHTDKTELSDGRKGRSKTRNRNPAERIPRPSSFLFKGTGKNSKSQRRSRRYENAMYLATYVAETEEDFYNFDVTPEHNNAFTRLLQDPKQLQVGVIAIQSLSNQNMQTYEIVCVGMARIPRADGGGTRENSIQGRKVI